MGFQGVSGVRAPIFGFHRSIWISVALWFLCTLCCHKYDAAPLSSHSPKQAQTQGYSRVLVKGLLITKESFVIMQLSGSTTNGKFSKWNKYYKPWCSVLNGCGFSSDPSPRCCIAVLRGCNIIKIYLSLSMVPGPELLKHLECPEWWQKCPLLFIKSLFWRYLSLC